MRTGPDLDLESGPEHPMRLTDLLTPERVAIHPDQNGQPLDKAGAIAALAQMLAQGRASTAGRSRAS